MQMQQGSRMQAIVYISSPTVSLSAEQIRTICTDAMERNKQQGITGFLCYHHKTFIQYIEGESESSTRLFENIMQDGRHKVDIYLAQAGLSERRFPSWQMKLIESEVMSELCIESFLHKQLMLMKSSSLLDEKWKTMIWRGVDIIANQRDAVGV